MHMGHPSMTHALPVLHTTLASPTRSVKGEGFTVAEIGRWFGVSYILATSWLELRTLQLQGTLSSSKGNNHSSSAGSVEGLASTGHPSSSSSAGFVEGVPSTGHPRRSSTSGAVEGVPSTGHPRSRSSRAGSVEGVPSTERSCCTHIWRDSNDPQLGALLTLALKYTDSAAEENKWEALRNKIRERFYKLNPKMLPKQEAAILTTLGFRGPRTLATLIPT